MINLYIYYRTYFENILFDVALIGLDQTQLIDIECDFLKTLRIIIATKKITYLSVFIFATFLIINRQCDPSSQQTTKIIRNSFCI